MTKYQTGITLTSSNFENLFSINLYRKKMIFHFKSSELHFLNFFRLLILSLTLLTLLLPANALGQYVCEKGDCVNGIGKKIVSNTQAYMEGKFVDGVLQEGKVLFPNGDVFQGKFENNKLLVGEKIFKDGRRLEGEFFDEVLVKGKITYMDGTSRFIQLKRIN